MGTITTEFARGPSLRLIGIQADDNIGELLHQIPVMEHAHDRA
jgi:hypothetical protein